MTPERTRRLLAALGKRISKCGDMPIRVSWRTLGVLREVLGLYGWEDHDDFREVDAMALDMLREAALRRLA